MTASSERVSQADSAVHLDVFQIVCTPPVCATDCIYIDSYSYIVYIIFTILVMLC